MLQDSKVYLYEDGHQRLEHPFRLIEAQVQGGEETIVFLTNDWTLNAMDIVRAYRYRWDIEILFRFIKQELNVKQLINRSEQGVKIQLYMAMITAILILVYKISQKKQSYKITKMEFYEQLLLIVVQQMYQHAPPEQPISLFDG